ncbi:MAG: c-type cytochrome, partial [Planctomycetes bacterium]|nr:c-type cytochrome [Planctomycetota bacterium]
EYYVDSLPPVLTVGPGSPVGIEFGYGTKFPAKYQKALYILDWTFGTIYAIHMEAKGASYIATKEEFVSRTPLPLTDVVIGSDGAMYFTVGGRGTQSELFRVTYVGKEPTDKTDAKDMKFAGPRRIRRSLEVMHGEIEVDDKRLDEIWMNLASEDRHLRYAARVALEHRDLDKWRETFSREANPQALITAAVALARRGDKSDRNALLERLGSLDFAKLTKTQQLDMLRAYALAFIRLGKPDQATAAAIAKKLDPYFPSTHNELNRELSRVLVYLNSPTVIGKTLELMAKKHEPSKEDIAELLARNPGYGGTIARMLANQPEIEKIHYAFALRTMRFGWTLDQRKQYFKWFDNALGRNGGASYQGFINNIRKEALANVSEAEKKALAANVIAPPPKPSELPKPKGPGKDWTLKEILAMNESQGLAGRDFENGRKMYAASRCVVCHRFDGNGGATGPDLTNVAGRFSYADLSEAIVDPNKVISDQYRAHNILTTAGQRISGRILGEANGKLTVLTDPEDATKVVEIAKGKVEEIQASKVSLMPSDLLKPLNGEEVLDLMAYLLSRGNPNDSMFAKQD